MEQYIYATISSLIIASYTTWAVYYAFMKADKIHIYQLNKDDPKQRQYIKAWLMVLFEDEAFLQEFLSQRQKWLQSKKDIK